MRLNFRRLFVVSSSSQTAKGSSFVSSSRRLLDDGDVVTTEPASGDGDSNTFIVSPKADDIQDDANNGSSTR